MSRKNNVLNTQNALLCHAMVPLISFGPVSFLSTCMRFCQCVFAYDPHYQSLSAFDENDKHFRTNQCGRQVETRQWKGVSMDRATVSFYVQRGGKTKECARNEKSLGSLGRQIIN